MPVEHPAYPSRGTLTRQVRIEARYAAQLEINTKIRAILDRCAKEILQLDLDGYSMSPGYDLKQIPELVADLKPILSPSQQYGLREWATDQEEI